MKKYSFFSLLPILFFLLMISSCKKDQFDVEASQKELGKNSDLSGHLKQTKTYSSEVVQSWIQMQLDLVRVPGGATGFPRPASNFAYCGIALYEAVVPGMPAYQSLVGQLTDFNPDMPEAEPGKAYHWPSSANAALAYMNRNIFTNATPAQQNAITALENSIAAGFSDVHPDILARSVAFGRAVAKEVLDWAVTDGSFTPRDPYQPPVGPGLWAPTPPNFPGAIGPYWGLFRVLVPGSLAGSAPPPPPAYSEDPSSEYYAMVKEVYDISQSLTEEQTAIGWYYADVPGYVGGSHYIAILMQLLDLDGSALDKAALAYAKSGIASADAQVGCWHAKYQYNVERPIRYIREVLGHTGWNPLFNTPGHPDYLSGHSTNGGAVEVMFSDLFGHDFAFSNHTYDYKGFAPRHYDNFTDMAVEIGKARVYAGIHYTSSCVEGRLQGMKVAQNVLNTLQFMK
ncbi:vanadium-dependent haloperoxidase [Flavihumibacter sp. ZG627]|uniref:vanadium-dependent haloperoxidase n=1 Tax=Flavihumibacter sp. ZG627 TaxID=1463156 RepID=UPI00155A862B|nr:vanadium-dependent haloperoxidase [Flavihumibacter sp. ZG627]